MGTQMVRSADHLSSRVSADPSASSPGETTFDIGIKMQDDVDYDPTMVDRTKVRLWAYALAQIDADIAVHAPQKKTPLWMPNQVDEDRMVSIPLRTANLGAINVSTS